VARIRLRGTAASPSYALVGIDEHDRIELPRSVHQALTKVVAALHAAGMEVHETDEDVMRVFVPGKGGAQQLFALAAAEHVQVRHLRPSVPTLEDVFATAVGEQ